MAHSVLVDSLKTAANSARSQGNPLFFLNKLESIHANWHSRTFTARRLGFLIFHWQVIEFFKLARCPQLWSGGIRPFRSADFTNFGSSYPVTVRAKPADINSLANFSIAVETWHNDAHMAVGMAFNIENDMMNPSVNIYYREFWRLHYFINDKFLQELRRYDSAGSVTKKIDLIEANQHPELHRI